MNVFTLFRSVSYYLNYRKRFKSDPVFWDAYRIENQKLAVTRVRTLCTIGLVAYLGESFMDYLLYPQQAPFFLLIRIFFAVVTTFCLGLFLTDWGKRQVFKLVFIMAIVADFGISLMSSHLDGWTSLYFVGNMLVAFGVAMFIPWRPRSTLIYCFTSLVGYISIVGWNHPFRPEMAIPTSFILILGAMAVLASLGSEVGRMSELASRLSLEKAHEDLKLLDKAKARFFANISHELRTPLTLIIGPLSALSKRGGVVSKEVLDSMTANAQRLMRQVNALLDLGKIDSQEMKCHPEVGNFKELISDLYTAAAPGVRERGLKLKLDILGDIPDSFFDLEKVETIVANLISNAIKFTSPGGTVIISAKRQSEERFLLSVKDTGVGISKSEKEKIFERFYQVDDSAKRSSKGTGLGLSVTKELVDLHGGRIWVESEPGVGSQFFVELPFHQTAENSIREVVSPVSNFTLRDEIRNTLFADIATREGAEYDDINIPAINSRRILEKSDKPIVLYIDDNRGLRDYVENILASDYTVLLAQDGQQGLHEAETHLPDLILSDIMMPKMSGVELLRAARNNEKLKRVPFVLLTADSSLDSRIESLEVGADDYLAKPFSEKELKARIKNFITLRQQSEALRRNILELEETQKALLESQNSLERRVEERTAQLTESLEREKAAKIAAENASHAKMQFLTNMSHEIRTPMNSILGFADLIAASNALEGENKEFLQRLRRNGSVLLHLIDDILDLSRFEAGQIPIHEEDFSLKQIIEETRQSFEPTLVAKGLNLEIIYDSDVPDKIAADGPRMRQILNNLLSNSIKFSEKGSVRIRARTLHQEHGDGMIHVDVEDSGPGISEENQRTLFQPFNQGDKTLNRRYGGSGLGLALSKRIAEAMGGKLELSKSAVNQGSHFYFEVPYKSVDTTKVADGAFTHLSHLTIDEGPKKMNSSPTPLFENKRILLAEDSPDSAFLIRHFLKATGATIDLATDGAQAVELAQREPYDCILMDMQMPVMNGLEATRHLRALGFKAPIVALTAHALPSEMERSIEAGCDFHLTKPVNKIKLIEVLSTYLDGV